MRRVLATLAVGACATVLISHAVTGANAAGGHAVASGVRNQRRADRCRRSVLRHVRLQRPQGATDLQLLSDQARRRLSDLGHGQSRGRGADRAENEPGGPAHAAQAHAGATQVRRHQSLSRRPRRTGELVSAVDAADRQGRLGRVDRPEVRAVANPAPFANWISGGGKVEPLAGDKDVFGDGTVVMLNMPGHTPGHHSLLVRLKEMGNVLITGDLAHFHENYETNGVPTFNTDRAASLASIDRFKKIADEPEGDGDHSAR